MPSLDPTLNALIEAGFILQTACRATANEPTPIFEKVLHAKQSIERQISACLAEEPCHL